LDRQGKEFLLLKGEKIGLSLKKEKFSPRGGIGKVDITRPGGRGPRNKTKKKKKARVSSRGPRKKGGKPAVLLRTKGGNIDAHTPGGKRAALHLGEKKK